MVEAVEKQGRWHSERGASFQLTGLENQDLIPEFALYTIDRSCGCRVASIHDSANGFNIEENLITDEGRASAARLPTTRPECR